jgi:hypothetical protein
MKKEKKVINREFRKDKPVKVEQLRIYNPDKNHPCHPNNLKHDYRFYPFSSYGCCARCGSEVLV